MTTGCDRLLNYTNQIPQPIALQSALLSCTLQGTCTCMWHTCITTTTHVHTPKIILQSARPPEPQCMQYAHMHVLHVHVYKYNYTDGPSEYV